MLPPMSGITDFQQDGERVVKVASFRIKEKKSASFWLLHSRLTFPVCRHRVGEGVKEALRGSSVGLPRIHQRDASRSIVIRPGLFRFMLEGP